MSPTPLSVYNERTPPNHLFFTSSLPSSRSQFARITALLFLFEFAVSFNLSILSTLLIFVFLTIYFKIRVNHIKMTSVSNTSMALQFDVSRPVSEIHEIGIQDSEVIAMTDEIQVVNNSENEIEVKIGFSLKDDQSITVHRALVQDQVIAMIDVISIGSLVDSQEPSIVQFQYTDETIGSSRIAPPIESEPDLISDPDFNLVPELEFDLDSQPDDLSDLITESDDDLVSVPKFFVVSEPDFDLRSEHEFGLVSEPENFKNGSLPFMVQENIKAKNARKEEERLVDYADLLANSVPDDYKVFSNGRRDLQWSSKYFNDDGYRAQNHQKLDFIEKASKNASPVYKDRILDSYITAKSIAPPARGPFGIYKQDWFGNIFSSYNNGEDWYQVCNLDNAIVRTNRSIKYQKEANRFWTNEHDYWLNTTSCYPEESLLGTMDKYNWLEARIYSLDSEILKSKILIAKKEEELKIKKGVDAFGFVIKTKRQNKEKEMDPEAMECCSIEKKMGFNPEAKAFVPKGI